VADTSLDRFLSAFEAAGMRRTRPRRLMAEVFAAHGTTEADFSIDQLWHEAQQRKLGLGRATLYRMVEALVQLGVLDRVIFADGTHRYRVCSRPHHHHLTCTECRQIVELPLCLPEGQLAAISRQTGFTIEGHAIEVFGICPACRATHIRESQPGLDEQRRTAAQEGQKVEQGADGCG
jgi:Fe2+ or Zn2+ uptake regulation protein